MFSYSIFRHVNRICENKRKHMSSAILFAKAKVCLLKTVKSMATHNRTLLTNSTSYCVNDILKYWTEKFELHNIPEPDNSAEIITAHVLGHKTLYSVDRKCTILAPSQISEVNRLCKLRLTRMPVQYVIGEWDFHDLTLKMRPPVLIPRPETEELAKLCINSLTEDESMQTWKILEIGAGTGAVSIFLLRTFKKLQGIALDISPSACKLTSENADNFGVSDRLQVIEGDFNHECVLRQLLEHGPYSLIVSNPPYISAEEMKSLQPEIMWFEDHLALDGGSDGMNLIRQIILQSAYLLKEGGHVWLEVDPQHPSSIQKLLEGTESKKELSLVETVKDAFGKDRFCHLQCT